MLRSGKFQILFWRLMLQFTWHLENFISQKNGTYAIDLQDQQFKINSFAGPPACMAFKVFADTGTWKHNLPAKSTVTWRVADIARNAMRSDNTVKCHYNACHYNANASLTRSILSSQTAPTCPHDHPRVAQHMGYRCEIMAVWSATAAMTPLCSHTNGMKQRCPTCWLCQYSRFMIDLRSNTLIIHLRCSENAINRPIWLPDARMLKTISVAIKLT